MLDRLIFRTLTVIVVTLISASAGAALIVGYWGLLEMLTGRAGHGAAMLAVCPVLAWVSILLIRNRDDLTDRSWVVPCRRPI